MMPLCLSSGVIERSCAVLRFGHDLGELARDVAFRTADDLAFGQAFREATLHVGAGARAPAQPRDHDHVERGIRLAVAATVESAPAGLARGCLDRAGSAQRGEGALV